MSKKRGTYMVTFHTGEEVIFGNNYKPWWLHAVEFTYRKFGSKQNGWRFEDVKNAIQKVSYSNQTFYDDGGLKWCSRDAYQKVIDIVVERQQLAPVNAKDIIFAESPADKTLLIKKLKEY